MDRRLMLEEGLSREVLIIGVLDPTGDNSVIGQAMQMLQIHQTGNQSRRCRRAPGSRWKETGPFPLEELPINQRGQLDQFVAHIDQINKARAQKIILFRRAITVLHWVSRPNQIAGLSIPKYK